ncbi:hypothetical protein QFC19_004322 [Naganishia cerealis]|uniref:Uncharacterized protein n=1 Tax=Naganishia cerealis TaxID=610337 RepID=A0ACC2VVS9_9TREE|nr:hypothetical protein QFC19_004322 [Naganishia cerealis]
MSDARDLERALTSLAECEQEMDVAERDAEIYRIKNTQKIYTKRSEIIKKIPNFWYIVLAENEDFAEYIRIEDLKYLEALSNIHVEYDINGAKPRNFTLTITFETENQDTIKNQTIQKHFEILNEDGEEKLVSEAVEVEWPASLDSINPHKIKTAHGANMSLDQKKLYRQGMKSFFAFFAWTGKKPGKEFRNGEELARLIVDDVYPYAVKYYTEALRGDDDDEFTSEGEELDISDSDSDEPSKKKTKTT